MFVLSIRPESRQVVIGHHEELFSDTVEVGELNWLSAAAPEQGARVHVQLRYRAPHVPARVASVAERLQLELDEEFASVTPGQSAVVFDGERVLGGGRIVRAGRREGWRACKAIITLFHYSNWGEALSSCGRIFWP